MRSLVFALALTLALAGCSSKDKSSPAATTAPVVAEKFPPGPAVPQVSKWQLDPENSSAEFVVKHVLSNVRGMIQKPEGTLTLDEANPANSKVNATLQVSAITTGVEERDTHLKSADFFDAAKFPTITFESTSVTKSGETSYSVTGNLSMHGVTKPVTLAVSAPPAFNHAGGIRKGIEATGTVNRKDFGLRWEFPGEGPGVVVGDNIKLTIDAELVLQP